MKKPSVAQLKLIKESTNGLVYGPLPTLNSMQAKGLVMGVGPTSGWSATLTLEGSAYRNDEPPPETSPAKLRALLREIYATTQLRPEHVRRVRRALKLDEV